MKYTTNTVLQKGMSANIVTNDVLNLLPDWQKVAKHLCLPVLNHTVQEPECITITGDLKLTISKNKKLSEINIKNSSVQIVIDAYPPKIKLKNSKLDLKFIYNNKEYTLKLTDAIIWDISSKEFSRFAIFSSIVNNVLEDSDHISEVASMLRFCSNFSNDILLQKFIAPFVNKYFLAINAVSKSLDGSSLAKLPEDVVMNITSYLNHNDIELAGENTDITDILTDIL